MATVVMLTNLKERKEVSDFQPRLFLKCVSAPPAEESKKKFSFDLQGFISSPVAAPTFL